MLALFITFALATTLAVGSPFPNMAYAEQKINDKHLLKQLADYAHRAHMVASKRCANLFDESCVNGGLPGANTDEEWLNNLGKRCANLFDEGCVNGGLPGANNDEEWLNSIGKRETENQPGFFKSLSDFFNRVHLVSVKRCANLFDESCANGGIPDAGKDESWLESIGKRSENSEKSIYKSLAELLNRLDMARDKRCANLFDESCINGGLPGANNDEEWLNSIGKRDLKGLLQSIHLG